MRQIESAIDELKAQVRSSRDELIDEIMFKSEQIIADLDTYQVECAHSLANSENTMAKVESKVERKRMKLDNFLSELRILNAGCQSNWTSILEKCESETNAMVEVIDHVRRYLLLNRFDEFKQKQSIFCQLKLNDFFEGFDLFKKK
jgi:hypothetical protein